MRKAVAQCILLAVLCLSGCKQTFYYDAEEMKEYVEKIEIVFIIDFKDEYEVLGIYENEDKDLVLDALAQVKYSYEMGPPYKGTDGLCLRLQYFDGTICFINQDVWLEYNSKDERIGERRRLCEKEDFEAFVVQFVDIDNLTE